MSKKLTSTREIAKTMGVSPMTVSKVLTNANNNVNVSEGMRSKIMEYVTSIGYRPNHNIGLIVPSGYITDEMESFFIRGAFAALEEPNRLIMNIDDGQSIPSLVEHWRVGGIISIHRMRDEVREEIEKRKIPYVIANPAEDQASNAVVFEDSKAIKKVFKYLKSEGCQSYAFFMPINKGHMSNRLRRKAFQDFLKKEKSPGKENENSDIHDLFATVKELKNHGKVGILVSNEWSLALSVLLEAQGFSVGKDIEIVSMGVSFDRWVNEQRQILVPFETFGRKSVEMINDMWEQDVHHHPNVSISSDF